MNIQIKEKEIMEFLLDIEKGEIVLTPQKDPSDIYAGDVLYKASNGWEITVFNDANEWDYINSIRTSDGREIDFDSLDSMSSVCNYSPSKEVSSLRYGIE